MMKYMLFIIGFIISVIGLFFIFLYLNILTIGYTFFDFVKFIISSPYCLLFFIGIIIISIVMKGWNKIELLLRRFNKFTR